MRVAAPSAFAAHAVIFRFAYGTDEARPLMTRLDQGVGLSLLLSGFLLPCPYALARFRGKQAPSVVPFARRLPRSAPCPRGYVLKTRLWRRGWSGP